MGNHTYLSTKISPSILLYVSIEKLNSSNTSKDLDKYYILEVVLSVLKFQKYPQQNSLNNKVTNSSSYYKGENLEEIFPEYAIIPGTLV